MVSAKVLVVALVVVCVLVGELGAQRNRTRGTPRRNRNRNRGNRGGGGSRGPGGRGGTAVRRCEEIHVPMCKGLVGYTRTKLPNRFNHTTQLQVYRVLEHMWALIDRGCSQNLRLVACSLFLPKCAGRGPGREPCAKTCKKTKRVCRAKLERFGYSWPQEIDCNALPKKKCLKMGAHNSCNIDYTLCESIDLPLCRDLSFRVGMFPNMFGQCNRTEVALEMEQFRPLLSSNCSPHLNFFLCGVYSPFCTNTDDGVLSFPCQELCEQVRGTCEPVYRRMTGGLPWPNKFQCHRYPLSTNANFTCVMPGEGSALGLR